MHSEARGLPSAPDADAPIGVFDSGVGGLSVLRALLQALPDEDFVYLADSAHAPYGERSEDFVTARTRRIADHLKTTCHAKALVIACNTATAAAIHTLRKEHSGWPIIGLEPALKPAVHATRTGRIGVLATRATLGSAKYAALRDGLMQAHPVVFVDQPCDGLAGAIEHGMRDGDMSAAHQLAARWLHQLGPLGDQAGAMDTVVLGCTHYPLIRDALQRQAGPSVQFIDAGTPVARHTHRLLSSAHLLRPADPTSGIAGRTRRLRFLATGDGESLRATADRLLCGDAQEEFLRPS